MLRRNLEDAYEFKAKEATEHIIKEIREYFKNNGPSCNAIVGISGGKDSSIVAALCCKALGVERVIGVLMPMGTQSDIDKAYELVDFLGIKKIEINIGETVETLHNAICKETAMMTDSAVINMPARIRMTTLFAVSQTFNGRVMNTCNLSEDYVGYSTLFGDSVGNFAPIARLTVTEVKEVGRVLGLPDDLIDKVPTDGLCGKTDEENLGFTYDELDTYIRTRRFDDTEKAHKIDVLHDKNKFKLEKMEYAFIPRQLLYKEEEIWEEF